MIWARPCQKLITTLLLYVAASVLTSCVVPYDKTVWHLEGIDIYFDEKDDCEAHWRSAYIDDKAPWTIECEWSLVSRHWLIDQSKIVHPRFLAPCYNNPEDECCRARRQVLETKNESELDKALTEADEKCPN